MFIAVERFKKHEASRLGTRLSRDNKSGVLSDPKPIEKDHPLRSGFHSSKAAQGQAIQKALSDAATNYQTEPGFASCSKRG